MNGRGRTGGRLLAVACGATVVAMLGGLVITSPAATATASARPTRICTPRQTLGGECGALPLRSCMNVFPDSTFNGATVAGLEYDDPSWVPVPGPADVHTCAVRLDLVPPKAESLALVPLLICEEAENAGTLASGSCKFHDTSQIIFSRFPSHTSAQRALFANLCATESLPGLPGAKIGEIQGLKACLNSSQGYAYVAADNILVQVSDFHPPDANTTPTAAMQKVLAYLLQ
jgi:hypothetical protein